MTTPERDIPEINEGLVQKPAVENPTKSGRWVRFLDRALQAFSYFRDNHYSQSNGRGVLWRWKLPLDQEVESCLN